MVGVVAHGVSYDTLTTVPQPRSKWVLLYLRENTMKSHHAIIKWIDIHITKLEVQNSSGLLLKEERAENRNTIRLLNELKYWIQEDED